MDGGVHGGGILALLDALDNDPALRQALSYDLIGLGLRLGQAGTSTLSWRDVYIIVAQAPRDSAVVRHLAPEAREWGISEQLQASIVDLLAGISWQLGGGKGKRPEPIPRPGVDSADTTQAPAPSNKETAAADTRDPWDKDGTGGTFRGVATPLDELNEWLGWANTTDDTSQPTTPADIASRDERIVAAYTAGGVTYAQLATEFSVSASTIGRIVRAARTT